MNEASTIGKPVPAAGTPQYEALISALFNACDPNESAGKYYFDLADARGGESVKNDVTLRLSLLRSNSYLRYLFSGHSGGGKSSELLDLAGRLAHPIDFIGGKRYFPVYLSADDYFNYDDLALPDLLLAIAAQVGAALKEPPLRIELADSYFFDLLRRAKESLFTGYGIDKFEAGVTIPGALASLKAIITPLRRDPSARRDVRHALTSEVENLGSEINRVLDTVRLRLKEHEYPSDEPHYDDIVLIIDNLEKLRVLGDEKQAESLAYDLFVRNAPTLTSLDVHMIYTVPLRAQYAFAGELTSAYGIAPFTMPMVAVEWRNRRNEAYPKGYNYLKKMLQLRADGYPLESLIASDALDWLIAMSGGHVRSLMRLAQEAFSRSKSLPVDLTTARKAVSQTLQSYSRSVYPSYFAKMAELHRSPRRTLDTSDIEVRAMLEQLIILEYCNGNENPEDLNEPWYAVNPIVRLLGGFKEALDAYDRAKSVIASS